MPTEIERKFLAHKPENLDNGTEIIQGYLAESEICIVRVRAYGDKGFVTIKSETTDSMVVDEFEYEIPLSDAKQMLSRCSKVVSKTRHIIYNGEDKWELDVFSGSLVGLVLAEFEHEDYDRVKNVELPWFVKRDVTGSSQYSNYALATKSGDAGI